MVVRSFLFVWAELMHLYWTTASNNHVTDQLIIQHQFIYKIYLPNETLMFLILMLTSSTTDMVDRGRSTGAWDIFTLIAGLRYRGVYWPLNNSQSNARSLSMQSIEICLLEKSNMVIHIMPRLPRSRQFLFCITIYCQEGTIFPWGRADQINVKKR